MNKPNLKKKRKNRLTTQCCVFWNIQLYWGNKWERWLLLFSMTAIQRDSQVLLFFTLHSAFVWISVKAVWKQSEKSKEYLIFQGIRTRLQTNTELNFFILVVFHSCPLSLTLFPASPLSLSVFFLLSVRSGPVAVFHAATMIMCFDTVRPPAVFLSLSRRTPWVKIAAVIQNYTSTRPPHPASLLVLALQAVLLERKRVQWVQPGQGFGTPICLCSLSIGGFL